MKMFLRSSSLVLLASLLGGMEVKAAPTTPSRVTVSQLSQFPYRTSGVIWGNGWRGSGTVARNPKIAISCAHVVFEGGSWLQGFDWAAAHHSTSHPTYASNKQALRGYWYWTGYNGGTSSTAFHLDYVVHYAYSNLADGAYAGWSWHDSNSAHPLATTGVSKLIVGYPGSDSYYMNSVGSFTSRYTSQYGHYLWNSAVKGGSGMSGGGVFIYSSGEWRLAGVHVSGSASGGMGAGVRALNQDAYNLMTSAIESTGTSVPVTTRSFGSSTALTIPDNSTTWAVRNIVVSGMPSSLVNASVSLNISHTYRGDLEVMLTSPGGRSIMLSSREGGSADNIVISGMNISSSYAGTNPNGTWKLSVRDRARGDVGRLNNVSLTLGSR